jgi:ubiquinone/menaquinone biosynthesis C-methylase UbiE
MLRILEPELKDSDQARAYSRTDFSASNQFFVDGLLRDYSDALRNVIDIGCGPCDGMLRLANARPHIQITAIDGSAAMIQLALEAVRGAGHEGRISPLQGYIPGLPFDERSFDGILSKYLLHHLPDPMVLWSEARRLGKAGAVIYVMDLIRPASPARAQHIVETVTPDEHPILKEDFFNSLCAAFTIEEAKSQLEEAGLPLEVAQISGLHMLIKGILR